MSNSSITRNYDFDVSDDVIHVFASTSLLGGDNSEFLLTQDKYAYKVKGGEDGYLCYKKGTGDNWVLIANWCFYGLYIVVRYRKPLWLRPMYQSLFAQMNFVSVVFHDHAIEIVGKDGQILRSRRFRLSPPHAVEEIMTEKFGYSPQKVEDLKLKLGFR